MKQYIAWIKFPNTTIYPGDFSGRSAEHVTESSAGCRWHILTPRTQKATTEGHDTLLSMDVLRKEAFRPVISESLEASWYERGVEKAVWVYLETQCPWPKLWCGKWNVAFGNNLCYLHTLILVSIGDIIICQTCLHNEEVSREIYWRSAAINMQVLPPAFLYSSQSPSPLLPHTPTHWNREVRARGPWSSTVGWSSMCHVLRRFSDSLTPFTSSPAHSAQGVMLCQWFIASLSKKWVKQDLFLVN